MLNPRSEASPPWPVRLLLKAGFQNQKQAEAALIVFFGLCILFTIWMLIPTKTIPAQNDPQQNPNFEPTTR